MGTLCSTILKLVTVLGWVTILRMHKAKEEDPFGFYYFYRLVGKDEVVCMTPTIFEHVQQNKQRKGEILAALQDAKPHRWPVKDEPMSL